MNFTRDLATEYSRYLTRRWFFKDCGVGLASIAAMDLLARNASAAPAAAPESPLAIKKPHYPAKVKRLHQPQ